MQISLGFLSGSAVKKKICLLVQEAQKMQVWSPGQEDPLKKETATHSSILAWRIPWTKKKKTNRAWWATVPGSQRVRYNWAYAQRAESFALPLETVWIQGPAPACLAYSAVRCTVPATSSFLVFFRLFGQVSATSHNSRTHRSTLFFFTFF